MTGERMRGQRLARLHAKGQAAQWSLDRTVDWSLDPRPTRWLPRSVVTKVVSQVYYGEVATERLCRLLLEEVEEPLARACLEQQIADERRHAGAYLRYLERLGDIAPIDPAVELALTSADDAPGGAIGKMVACHLVLESEALTIQEELSHDLNCPLLRSINRLAAPDEARHVAFGRIYLGDALDRDAAGRADATAPLRLGAPHMARLWRQATARRP